MNNLHQEIICHGLQFFTKAQILVCVSVNLKSR